MKKIALVCMMLAALFMVAFAGEALDVNSRYTVSKEATPTAAPEMKMVEPSPAPVADAVDIMAQLKALEADAERLAAANDEISLEGVKAEMNALMAQLNPETRPFIRTLDATGDDCTDPIVITLPAQFPYSDTNTNCGRLNTYSNTCLGSYDGGEDIIYRVDVTSDVTVNITVTSASTWKGIAIDPACPLNTTTCLAKITTTGSGPLSLANVALVAGTYYIMIDTYPSPTCIPEFVLNITNAAVPGRCCYRVGYTFQCVDNTAAECTALGGTWNGALNCTSDPCPQPPANDLCTGAIDVSVPGSIQGDNTTALNDTMVSCGVGGTMGAQLWYRVTGDGTTYTASTCDAYTTFDTEISVWVGDDCGNLTCVGSNDDAGSTLCPDGTAKSVFSWCALPGVRYYVAVGSYSYTSGKGLFQLNMSSDGVDCTDPLGRCCYGDPEAPSCQTITESECEALTGEWTVGLNCDDNPCPLPFHGDDCTDPLVISGFPYVDARDNTGATNVYDGAPACFTQVYYDDGAEVVYELTVTEKTCIVASLDQGTDYDYCSLSLWAGCPDVGTCLWGGYASFGVINMPCTELQAGVYYIMVDNWPTPDIFEYTLTVDACECPSPCESYVLCGTPAEIEPNDVCPAPAEQAIIECEETVYGLLCPATDVDYWAVIIPPYSKLTIGIFDGENCDVNPATAVYMNLYYSTCGAWSTTPQYSGYAITNGGATAVPFFVKVAGVGISQYSLTTTCCPLVNPCDNPIVINAGYTYEATVNTCPTDPCGTANVVPGVWEDLCGGSAYTSGPDAIFMLTLYETANDIDITALAAGTGDEQVMVFTDCVDPMGSCVASQDMLGSSADPEVISDLVLTPGTYYISVSYYGAATCGDITLTINSDVILPVEFGDVDAVAGDHAITLNWNTITETNTDHFEIVRDGVVKGRVDAAGNSTTNRNYSWTEDGLDNGVNYTYTLKVVDVNGAVSEVATVNATPSFENGVVTEYALHQNYPNPFNPATTIAFDLKDAGFVNLKVYNLMGQEVATVMNGSMVAGRHMVTFDASNLSSGIYLYRIEVNGFAAEKKMLLMK